MYFFNIKYHLIVSWGWILVSTFILSKLLLLMFSMFNEGVETNTQGKKKKGFNTNTRYKTWNVKVWKGSNQFYCTIIIKVISTTLTA